MLKGTIDQWKKDNQEVYESQITNFMIAKSTGNDVGSLAIGDNKEFKKRINLMFDNLGENEVLKKMHIAPGKFSQYLPEEIIELSPEMKKEANEYNKTLHRLVFRRRARNQPPPSGICKRKMLLIW